MMRYHPGMFYAAVAYAFFSSNCFFFSLLPFSLLLPASFSVYFVCYDYRYSLRNSVINLVTTTSSVLISPYVGYVS